MAKNIISKCKDCESKEMYLNKVGNNMGLYCMECNSWQTWVKKKDLSFYNKVKGYKIIEEE